ncbi:MAG: hypothetical protein ACYC43_03125, partial [Burkholderiales bacterium]
MKQKLRTVLGLMIGVVALAGCANGPLVTNPDATRPQSPSKPAWISANGPSVAIPDTMAANSR